MSKGAIGASMGGSIEYRHQLKPTTRNCRNCKNYKSRTDPVTESMRPGLCARFGIRITDTTNAQKCSGFENKHEATASQGGRRGGNQ